MALAQTRVPRVFIDSSVFFAAALSPTGGGRELFHRGIRGSCSLLVSDLVLTETRRNLFIKAPDGMAVFEQLAQLPFLVRSADPTVRQVDRVARVVERKDAPIVAAAVRAKADYVATYDRRHLLAVREAVSVSFGIKIATPGDILEELR